MRTIELFFIISDQDENNFLTSDGQLVSRFQEAAQFKTLLEAVEKIVEIEELERDKFFKGYKIGKSLMPKRVELTIRGTEGEPQRV